MNACLWRDVDLVGAETLLSDLYNCVIPQHHLVVSLLKHTLLKTISDRRIYGLYFGILLNSPMPELPPVMSTVLSERSRPCRMSRAEVFPS